MTAKIIDGKAVAQRIRSECAERVRLLAASGAVAPGLAVILVGDDPASGVYVNNKIKACEGVGIRSLSFRLHGMLVRPIKAATGCEFEAATETGRVMQTDSDFGYEATTTGDLPWHPESNILTHKSPCEP